MSRFEIDDLIEIIASHHGGLSMKALCDDYEIRNKTWIQPEHETQIKNCLKANPDKVYCDNSGLWHKKQQTVITPNIAPNDQRRKGTEVRNREDIFFKTPEGQAFLRLFDYIGTRYYIAPIPTVKRGTSYDQRDIPRENNICYDFFIDNMRIGVLYYKNGSTNTFTSFELELKYLNSKDIKDNIDLTVFDNSDDTKNGRYKFQISDFPKVFDSVEALCDEIDKRFELFVGNKRSGYKYVSFTEDRIWKNAVTYGFISAGYKSKKGKSYSSELFSLKVGDKVFVHIKALGYVGYGIVEAEATIAKDVIFTVGDQNISFAELSTNEFDYLHHSDDPEMADYVVKIQWLHTVDKNNGVYESGMFSSQHIVCDPPSVGWINTVNRLRKLWNIE